MQAKRQTIQVNDSFQEINTKTIDDRNRITLGDLLKGCNRVKLYKNSQGEILLKPLVEIPSSEAWLFENKEALESVKKGLKDASEGKVTKFNLDEL